MKSATIPSLRVEPKLRKAVECSLNSDETLSSFMEQALREQVSRRKIQNEFIARGLVSRDKAKQSGEYFSANEVLDHLDSMLANAEKS
ncbi:MAG: prevent-host-death protein [Desulfocapsa sp.]|nr:prevent-host-death protein [Desulfocapsa sp.]MBN4048551.1 prevent-host-death protein [bacterium AH-315-N22]